MLHIRPVAPFVDMDRRIITGVLAKLFQRLDLGAPTAPACILVGDQGDGAVQADIEQLFDILHVRKRAKVLHIRAVASEIGKDGLSIFRVLADFTRQREKLHALVEVHLLRLPSLGQAGALRFVVGLHLDIGAKPPGLQQDGLSRFRMDAKLFAVRIDCAILFSISREGAGKLAVRIARAAHKGPVPSKL